MFDYGQELARRIDQFAGYLSKMYRRAHEEVHGPCFIIFEEKPPADTSGERALAESVKPAFQLAMAGFDDAGVDSITVTDHSPMNLLPDEGWKQDDTENRFIQFSIEKNWFCLDMPLQTLYRAEAEHILQCRKGFFYLRDRPEFTLTEEAVEGYDPFRKIYIYGDEQSAAEDMAFIFFQVWRFPVGWRFYVKAAALGNKTTAWENGTPVE